MGSTYFYDMLKTFYAPYQNFMQWKEVFNLNNRKPTHDIDKIIHDAYTNTDVVATNHINYFDRLSQQQKETFFNLGWYNIVLLRRNFLDCSISLAKSTVTNEWSKYTQNKITVPIEIFDSSLNAIFHNVKNIIHNQYNIPYKEVVYYENLTFNPETDFHNLKLSKTYNMEQYKDWYPEIDFYKYNSSIVSAPSKKDTIANYDELVEYAESQYHKFTSKRFKIKQGFIRRINIDTQYIDISEF